MERWSDQGIVLSSRPHGEGAAIASVLTAEHGRYLGFIHGGRTSSRLRALLQPGAVIAVQWSAQTESQLGRFEIDDGTPPSPLLADDPERLLALLSATALLDICAAERTPHPALFHGTIALFDALAGPVWAAAYVMWEIALLREIGFGIDLSRCAVTGEEGALTHISPKTGRGVSAAAAAPYKEKLLQLPDFLAGGGRDDAAEIALGLKMTGYFIENRVLAHTTHVLPEARARLVEKFEKPLSSALS